MAWGQGVKPSRGSGVQARPAECGHGHFEHSGHSGHSKTSPLRLFCVTMGAVDGAARRGHVTEKSNQARVGGIKGVRGSGEVTK